MHARISTTTRGGRSALAAAAAGALAVALAGGSLGIAAPGAKPAVKRIHLIEREVSTHMIDLGKRGFSAGDRQTITSDILDPATGRVIGRADLDCAVTAVGNRVGGLCSGAITLPHGQITDQFFQAFGATPGTPNRQAVTGGTGRYRGARGQFIVGKETTARTPFTIELVG